MGYTSGNLYHIFVNAQNSFITSRDVKFIESERSIPNHPTRNLKSDLSTMIKFDTEYYILHLSPVPTVSNTNSADKSTFGIKEDSCTMYYLGEDSENGSRTGNNEDEYAKCEKISHYTWRRRSELENSRVPPTRYGHESAYIFTDSLHNIGQLNLPTVHSETTNCTYKIDWISAMEEEIITLQIKVTWTLVLLPPGKKNIFVNGFLTLERT